MKGQEEAKGDKKIEATVEYIRKKILKPGEMSQVEYQKLGKVVEEIRKEERQFSVLKFDDDSLQLFANTMEQKNKQSLFLENLQQTPLKTVIVVWLNNLSTGTRRNYAYNITDMIKRNIIPAVNPAGNAFTVEDFNFSPHEAMIDYIKTIKDWKEGTRQVRAACYISLTTYLERISQGWFRRALPSVLPANKTFFQVNEKCVTEALSMPEWYEFIKALHKINERDSLIARCLLHGAKRISEVLDLTLEQVDFETRIIRFQQKKTGGMVKKIPITYPKRFMAELRRYISIMAYRRGSSKHVFVSSKGNKLTRARFNHVFAVASANAGIKKVSPHMLRATWVTWAKKQQVQDTEIMKVTGHSSSKMIYQYDKSSAEDNVSKKLIWI